MLAGSLNFPFNAPSTGTISDGGGACTLAGSDIQFDGVPERRLAGRFTSAGGKELGYVLRLQRSEREAYASTQGALYGN